MAASAALAAEERGTRKATSTRKRKGDAAADVIYRMFNLKLPPPPSHLLRFETKSQAGWREPITTRFAKIIGLAVDHEKYQHINIPLLPY